MLKTQNINFLFYSFLDKIKLIFDIFILEEVNVKNTLSIWLNKLEETLNIEKKEANFFKKIIIIWLLKKSQYSWSV